MWSLARTRKPVVVFSVAALVIVVVVAIAVGIQSQRADTANAANQPPSGYTSQSNVPGSPPVIGSTLTTSEGLTITLLGVEKHGTRWLFHVKMVNASRSAQQAVGSQDHRFVLPGRAADGSTVDHVLSSPATSELALHPALPQDVAAGSSANGWIAGDISRLGTASPPREFIFEYDPIASQKCTNLLDQQSTCSPVTLYHMLLWEI